MAGKKQQKTKENGQKMDYENLDIADIMSQIKRKNSPSSEDRKGKDEERDISRETENQDIPPETGMESRSKIKKFLQKIMKPVSPLIKLMVFPVHQEAMNALSQLDQTNRRLDHLYQEQMKMMKSLEENLYRLNDRLDVMSGDSDRAQEVIKLLHNLAHNIVVEMTKLKIEEESLKTKTRSLEKSLELVEWKEKALEKKILQ